MELRPGYKQTKVGAIPEEWNATPLGSIAQLKNGYAFKSTTYTSFGQFKVITIANVQDGYMDNSECNKVAAIPPDVQSHQKLQRQDILISMTGNVGRVCRVNEDGCFLNQRVGHLVATGVDAALLFMLLSQRAFIVAMTGKAKGGAQGNLSVSDITEYQFAVPPTLAEQRAIAAALGDVDALLGGLTQLIAKKRDLKQAAMQQILTGQIRLPGFSGEWEVKRLRDVAEIVSGGTPRTSASSFWDGDVKWCTPTDITRTVGKYLFETERTISQAGLDSCSAQLLPPGALLLCSRATIGELKIAGCEVCTNQGFKSLIAKRGISGEYLYYLLLTMKAQMVEKAIGSTFLEISWKDTASLEVSVPLFDEQASIAAVLSDMDTELAGLEARLGKTRALKQGMMQELLTGRTRLV